jgi:hypothetical protein
MATPSAVSATVVGHDSLGVHISGSPSNLATASASGLGVARTEVNAGWDTDAIVQRAAEAHLRLYPMLGLPVSHGAAADAEAMRQFVTSFARTYGPGGSFWATHPQLPYLPVMSYEIGNEPDITPSAPLDGTSLHYANPADFAVVYKSARSALHRVNPAARAVVGGLLDSDTITLRDAERYLAPIGPMDAVGFHPYVYDLSRMQQDTVSLRLWLNTHHHSGVPLDVNEFGGFNGVGGGIASWGSAVATYTKWALCTPFLRVENVQPFWWGGVPGADANQWYSLFGDQGNETPLGSAYLKEVRALTTRGCPIARPARRVAPKTTRPRSRPVLGGRSRDRHVR